MAAESSRLVRQSTFALLALAAAAVEVAAVDSRPVLTSVGMAAIWVGLAALLGWFVPLPADGRGPPPLFVRVFLVALTLAPFLVEPLRRHWTGEGYPLELQMVFALRNLGLGLAAFAGWLLCLRLACVVSLFLVLFAVTMTEHPAVMTLLGLYGATGSAWLMLVYWTGLRRSRVAAETAVVLDVVPRRQRLPWLLVLGVVGLVGCVPGLMAVGPERAARVLAEWLPTSGGTSSYDPFARGGVNDGDDEVKGANARSTGTVQSDTFLDSPLPSLYDMFDDRYGEPFKPRDRERAIAVDGQPVGKRGNKPPADNLRPNREFPSARKSPRQPRDPSDRAARALFEVEGRTPLHVRVTAFDLFDGVAWHEAPLRGNPHALDREPNSCWMRVREPVPPAVFAEAESHRFKITGPLGTLVPTPPHLVRFRVGRVDRADFFAWGQDRILRMAERKTPSGIVVETECRTVDPRLLGAVRFPRFLGDDRPAYAAVPPDLNPQVAELARLWAEDLRQGWPQIDAIVRHLRSEFALDPTARVPEDCRDPLGHFLLHARRAPDYQFAGAAAVLLRALDYQTRLVSGFYAAPEHYDPLTHHTPVVAEDLHFWAEVRLPSGDWLVIEPTPGYEVPGPNLAVSERLWAAVLGGAAWVWRHGVESGLALTGIAGMWWWRREVLDAAAVSWWRCFPGRTWRQCVRRALWLLERRGRWAGRPRGTSQTAPAWLRSALPGPFPPEAGLDELTAMAEWAAYAPELEPPWRGDEVWGACRRALDAWTLRRWRRAVAAGGPDGA
jgi:transglutaminase-like putative cysteine protease